MKRLMSMHDALRECGSLVTVTWYDVSAPNGGYVGIMMGVEMPTSYVDGQFNVCILVDGQIRLIPGELYELKVNSSYQESR